VKLRPSDLLYAAIFLAALAATGWGMLRARAWAFATYGGSESQVEWEEWREDVKKNAENPAYVKRRMPKSVEPPALVLMRDYFPVCMAGSLALTGVLAGAFLFFIRGAASPSQPFVDRTAPDDP
jgi:hypothetical protein